MDPRTLVKKIDHDRLERLRGKVPPQTGDGE